MASERARLLALDGCGGGNRTRDDRDMGPALYLLSYPTRRARLPVGKRMDEGIGGALQARTRGPLQGPRNAKARRA